jgi:hypothetical protein
MLGLVERTQDPNKETPVMSENRDYDRDTVVVKDSGSSSGMMLGIIAILIVLAAAWYFLMGPGAGTTTPSDVNVDVNLPSLAPASS